MKQAKSLSKKYVFHVVNFHSIQKTENEFLRLRHSIDSKLFDQLSDDCHVSFLKLKDKGCTTADSENNEQFFNGKNAFFHLPFKLCRYIKKEKPDILFIHGFVFPIQLLLLEFFMPKKAKLIVQHHAEKPYQHPVKRWFQKIAYSRADAYVFASKELALPYLNSAIITDEKKIHEVMEGSSLFHPQHKQEAKTRLDIKEEIVFLWVGRLDPNKDPLTVLKAFQKFKAAGNHFKLYMIYGTNELEETSKAYINAHRLHDAIELIGEVQYAELENWYNAADYFIAASHYEGSGIALCEAMACGCIPVVTHIASFTKMTEQGQYGLLFEPGDAHGLFKKLLLLSTLNKEEMRQKILKHFKEELSLPAIGKKMGTIATSLLQK